MAKLPYGSYLFLRPFGYVFRIVVPTNIRDKIGKTEVRISLRTSLLRLARVRADLLAYFITNLFDQLRAGGRYVELNQKQINETLQKYAFEIIDQGESISIERIIRETVKVNNHDLRFHKCSKDGSAKCDAYFTSNADDVIYGTLFKIDPNEKSALDKAEGLGYGYDEKEVTVTAKDGTLIKAVT